MAGTARVTAAGPRAGRPPDGRDGSGHDGRTACWTACGRRPGSALRTLPGSALPGAVAGRGRERGGFDLLLTIPLPSSSVALTGSFASHLVFPFLDSIALVSGFGVIVRYYGVDYRMPRVPVAH